MGSRSATRVFRRRRRRTGFALLLSLVIVVFGALALAGPDAEKLRAGVLGGEQGAGAVTPESVARVESPNLSGTPDVAEDRSAEKPTRSEQPAVGERPSADEGDPAAKPEQAAAPEIPKPPTNDLWMSIPKMELYDDYVANDDSVAAMDAGAIKLPSTGFPWQDNSNTYIAAHRLGWPGTASYYQFYDLPNLAIGDRVYLGDANGTTYTYEVTGFKEVLPSETWVTSPKAGRDMISLQTCIEDYGDYWTMGPNWYVRYVVQADRVSVDPAG